jgi:iron complex transport system ATP-binding protein
MIELKGVHVRLGGRTILHGVDFSVAPGEVLALVGPNGSGKSTLLRAIAGQQALSEGAIDATGPLGYLPQDNGAAARLTVIEALLVGRHETIGFRVHPDDRTAAIAGLTDLGLSDLANRRLDRLSGGQRQLVYLAQTLMRDPRTLLLDEPTSALDLSHQLLVLDVVRSLARSRGLAVVLAIHDLALAARVADRFAVLDQGRLAALGTPLAVLNPELLDQVYRVKADIICEPGLPLSMRLLGRRPAPADNSSLG